MHLSKYTYWGIVRKQFSRHRLGVIGLCVIILFIVAAIYAPFLASSQPIVIKYDQEWYFPLFRYLFYRGYYTKAIDLFYNVLIFTFPLGVAIYICFKNSKQWQRWGCGLTVILQIVLFLTLLVYPLKSPTYDENLVAQKNNWEQTNPLPSWKKTLSLMTPYARIEMLINYSQMKEQDDKIQAYLREEKQEISMATLWQQEMQHEEEESERLKEIVAKESSYTQIEKNKALASIQWREEKQQWIQEQLAHIQFQWMPLIRQFHWEEDAGGDQALNEHIPWKDITRINRKDLVAALIFGIRISLSVGFLAIAIALLIGIPVGAFSGYYGGKIDMLTYRFIEIWEAMPTFFMLLMIVSFLQSKSIFLVIAVIGFFGWTGFSRFIRGEFLKQKQLSYVEACYAMGFNNSRIIFSHILPNAIPPVLTLVPFAIMGAITSEAGLSFLGLGEESSSSWGVLMDEGRTAFPSESYLLWPPAILLTTLLVSIALVGDALRDALDPKLH